MLKNTLIISGLSLLTFPAPIILALIMNEVRNAAFKKFVQTAVYLPHFLSWAIVASLTFFLLSTEQGLVNKIAEMMGNEPTAYMFSSGWIYVIILVQSVWKGIGWGSIWLQFQESTRHYMKRRKWTEPADFSAYGKLHFQVLCQQSWLC